MGEFRFTCKQCEQEILVEDSDCGKVVVCQKCGKSNVVPARPTDAKLLKAELSPVPVWIYGGTTTETKSLKKELTYRYVCTCCGSKVSERAKRFYIRHGGFDVGIGLILFGLIVIPILLGIVHFISAVTPFTFIVVSIIIGLFVGPIAILFVAEGIYRSLRGDSTQCPVCGNFNSLIPIASPRGRQLIRDANCICSDDKSIDGCV